MQHNFLVLHFLNYHNFLILLKKLALPTNIINNQNENQRFLRFLQCFSILKSILSSRLYNYLMQRFLLLHNWPFWVKKCVLLTNSFLRKKKSDKKFGFSVYQILRFLLIVFIRKKTHLLYCSLLILFTFEECQIEVDLNENEKTQKWTVWSILFL